MSVWGIQDVGVSQFWKSDIRNKCVHSVRFLCEIVILVHEHEQDKAVLNVFDSTVNTFQKYCPGIDP